MSVVGGAVPGSTGEPAMVSQNEQNDGTEFDFGPDVEDVGRELLQTISELFANERARQDREDGLARERSIETSRRYIGEIVHIPRKDVIGESMVHNHYDFAKSNPYNHPAVIVHISNNILTCLKLTGTPVVDRWFVSHGPTIASTYRALLYLPIDHKQGEAQEVRRLYEVPLLEQGRHQRDLNSPSVINTERAFEIESKNVRTYRPGYNADHAVWRRDKQRSFGYSLDLDSLNALAKYILSTPSLRTFSRQEIKEHGMGYLHLSVSGVKWLSRYVQQIKTAQVFEQKAWKAWLTSQRVTWETVKWSWGNRQSKRGETDPKSSTCPQAHGYLRTS